MTAATSPIDPRPDALTRHKASVPSSRRCQPAGRCTSGSRHWNCESPGWRPGGRSTAPKRQGRSTKTCSVYLPRTRSGSGQLARGLRTGAKFPRRLAASAAVMKYCCPDRRCQTSTPTILSAPSSSPRASHAGDAIRAACAWDSGVVSHNADIRAWIDTWNNNLRPFVWTKTADEILESITRYCKRLNDSGH
jgi:hypothetical protein